MARLVIKLLGAAILAIGIVGLGDDLLSAIADRVNDNPNHRVVTTFPFGTLYGTICVWLGYRLLFTNYAKASAGQPQPPPIRTDPPPT